MSSCGEQGMKTSMVPVLKPVTPATIVRKNDVTLVTEIFSNMASPGRNKTLKFSANWTLPYPSFNF
jgi:hypothetical protein